MAACVPSAFGKRLWSLLTNTSLLFLVADACTWPK